MNKKTRNDVASILVLCLATTFSFGQTTSRTYANFQGMYRTGLFAVGLETVFGQVSDPGKAVDGNVDTRSILNIPAGLAGLASVTQYLGFTSAGTLSTARVINGGVPVSLKLSLPQSAIGLADNIEIGIYTGLQAVSTEINGVFGTGAGNAAGYKASNRQALYSGAALINVLNGAGAVELQLTPSQNYEGVYVKLSGDLLSVALSMQLFHAYIIENNPIACSLQGNAIDILSGVRGNSSVNLLSATGSVAQPWSAVDAGPSRMNTYATLNTGAQVLSEIFETIVFNTTARQGDSLQLVVEDPGAQLLDLNLLGGLKITPYNGAIAGSVITTAQAGISLRLLSAGTTKYILSVPVPAGFDRVDISLGGVASVLSQLRIYDVQRIIPVPAVNGSIGVRQADTITVYKGSSIQLTANSNDPVSWHAEGGAWLADGSTYTISPVLAEGVYVATATRNGCSQFTSSYSVYLKVLEHSTLPVRDLVLEGKKEQDRISVHWLAKGEYAVNHYTLQKRNDSGGYNDIALILAAGNYTDVNYSFRDRSPVTGNNMYRLAIHEQSGGVSYSATINVLWQQPISSGQINVYPNPVNKQEMLFVEGLDTGEYLISILGTSGKSHRQVAVRISSGQGSVAVERGELQAGMYWLNVIQLNAAQRVNRRTAAFWIR